MTDAAETVPDFWVARLVARDAERAWPKALRYLEPAIRRGDDLFDAESVRELVTRPQSGGPDGWSLWLLGAEKKLLAAWTTNPVDFPKGRVLAVTFGGGSAAGGWYATALAETEAFARANGFIRLRCAGREGWARRGYTKIGSIFERTLA